MLLRACQLAIQFPRPAMLMGIVNVTPDSFSDGGHYLDTARAIDHALQLASEGADFLDVGGESTRPSAAPVEEAEELRRVLPVIRGLLAQKVSVPISIDTMKPRVARQAIEAGACIINDVAANRTDTAMWDVVRETGAGYVLMHMQGTPQTMQRDPRYADVTGAVAEFYGERLSRLAACGVSAEHVILDPGIGFGKTAEHNLELLARMGQFTAYQRPLLIGASRKGFIGHVTGVAEAAARVPGSIACALVAVAAGAQIIRTHDVAATRQAVRMWEAIQARR
jgi:dihydropteroate synthase